MARRMCALDAIMRKLLKPSPVCGLNCAGFPWYVTHQFLLTV